MLGFMNMVQFTTLVVLLLAVLGLVALSIFRPPRRRTEQEFLERVTESNTSLAASFSKANADMAARVEQVKGDVRTDLADRLQQGLGSVRETVDRQLTEGRGEQTRRLGETVIALEQKFDGLRTATEARLDQVSERQTVALRESRTELSQALAALATGLQAKLDQMRDGQAAASADSRKELAQTLGESTKALQQRFEALEQKTSQSLEAIRASVDARLVMISDQVQQKLEKNIQEGFAHFQKVQEHLRAAEEQLRNVGVVGQSINELNNLLKLPHLRGKFGEAELGRLLADFLPTSAFEEQAVVTPGSREKVDAVVRFPKFMLPIDSKFNREQILPLFETNDPAALEDARRQLATTIKQQARDIAEKYIHPEHGTTDLALMFLPSETIYFEVIRNGELCQAVHKLKVFPVSPNTLAITLRTVAMSISHFEFAKNVEKTLEQVRLAQDGFAKFQKRFEEVGKGIERAQDAYQTASGHLNRYANRVVRLTGEPAPELALEAGEGMPPSTAEGGAPVS